MNLALKTPRGKFWLSLAILLACFSVPLFKLVQFAAHSELYSYILIIPFVTVQLVWNKRRDLPSHSEPARAFAALAALTGAALLTISASRLAPVDRLTLTTGSFFSFFFAGCFWFLGKETVRILAFPLGFLVFLIPLPHVFEDGVVTLLQQGSSVAAAIFFKLSGTPFVQDGTAFQLPGFSLQVAPECSGIHSTVVLLITSVVAGYSFLRTPWKCAVLSLAVIPLALLRNGFRVFVIGMLCVHVSPEMINSPIHHRGGPIFFVLSLIPFFILLYFLYKSDRALTTKGTKNTKGKQEL